MSAEKLPHEGLPRYTESIVGTWVSERWSGGELDRSRRCIQHYSSDGRVHWEFDFEGERSGLPLCKFSTDSGFLIFSNHSRDLTSYSFQELELFQDGDLILFWRPATGQYWWLRRLEDPPPYAYGFVDSTGVLRLLEPSEPAIRSLIIWRKPVKVGY